MWYTLLRHSREKQSSFFSTYTHSLWRFTTIRWEQNKFILWRDGWLSLSTKPYDYNETFNARSMEISLHFRHNLHQFLIFFSLTLTLIPKSSPFGYIWTWWLWEKMIEMRLRNLNVFVWHIFSIKNFVFVNKLILKCTHLIERLYSFYSWKKKARNEENTRFDLFKSTSNSFILDLIYVLDIRKRWVK